MLDLLLSLFADAGAELRAFLRRLDGGPRLLQSVPEPPVEPAVLIDRVVDVLARHGRLDAGFFAALVAQFPRRRGEIVAAASSIGLTFTVPNEGSLSGEPNRTGVRRASWFALAGALVVATIAIWILLQHTDREAALAASASVAPTETRTARMEPEPESRDFYDAAVAKANAGDGRGCLAELDNYDELEPKRPSTDPKQRFSALRAQCLMMAGECEAGKSLYREHLPTTGVSRALGPRHIDRLIEAYVASHCVGDLEPRDALLRALMRLHEGAYKFRIPVEACREHYTTICQRRYGSA